MNRAFVNVLCSNVEKSAQFYQDILNMTRHADFGWFVILTHPDMPQLEFGLLDKTHSIVPTAARRPAGGMMMTFVVADLGDVEERAVRYGADAIEPPRDMPYGQRRMILQDPDGTLIDISSRIAA